MYSKEFIQEFWDELIQFYPEYENGLPDKPINRFGIKLRAREKIIAKGDYHLNNWSHFSDFDPENRERIFFPKINLKWRFDSTYEAWWFVESLKYDSFFSKETLIYDCDSFTSYSLPVNFNLVKVVECGEKDLKEFQSLNVYFENLKRRQLT